MGVAKPIPLIIEGTVLLALQRVESSSTARPRSAAIESNVSQNAADPKPHPGAPPTKELAWLLLALLTALDLELDLLEEMLD